MRQEGKKINRTMKEVIHNIGDEGFPYLLTLPRLSSHDFYDHFPSPSYIVHCIY